MLDRLRRSRPVHRLEIAAHEHGLDHVVLTADVERWLLRAARIFTLLVLGAVALAALQFGDRGHDYVAWEETALLAAMAVAAVSLVVAWWWQPAAAVTLVAAVFAGALTAFDLTLLIALAVALLFMVPAALYLMAWQRTQSWLAIITLGVAMVVLLVVGGVMAQAAFEEGHGGVHPVSALEPLPESAVTWIWSGGVTVDSATVVAKVPDAREVRLVYSAASSPAEPSYVRSSTRGPIYRFHLEGLTPGTTYRYAVEAEGAVDEVRSGEFATFALRPRNLTVAFGSCAHTGSRGSVFDTIRELEPDLFIHMGDFHYGDVADNALGIFDDLYDTVLTSPPQAALYRSVPVAYVWDDHDFGPNNSAADSPSRPAALVSYRQHVPHYPFALDGGDAPIAQAFTIGRTRFILTDTRSARRPGADGTVLGSEQLEWFLDELSDSLDRYPLVVWVSTVPWIAEPRSGADDWGGYSGERERIANTIASAGSESLVVLAGDAHMVAIDDGSHHDYSSGGGASFPVMQAAALDRVGSVKGGPYSQGPYPGGGQFGIMTVEDRGDEIRVRLRGLNWQLDELVALERVIPAAPD